MLRGQQVLAELSATAVTDPPYESVTQQMQLCVLSTIYHELTELEAV